MNIISVTLFLLFYAYSCSFAPTRKIILTSKKIGHDVSCAIGSKHCYRYARNICKGFYRIHNTYNDKKTNMRFQCVKDQNEIQKCKRLEVNCVL